MNLYMVSLGCAKNQVDTEMILGVCKNKMTLVSSPSDADLIMINTCAFIESARKEAIDTILQLADYKENGAKIILFTSRNMNSYNGNLGLINKNTAKVLSAWLDKWDIPYDEILYGKPWPGHKGFYVDDRTVRPDEFLNCSVEELDTICRKSKEQSK